MNTIMNERQLATLEQVAEFLSGSADVEFQISSQEERYGWIQEVLERFNYPRLKRKEKGLVLRYLIKISGYSDAQLERLIAQFKRKRSIKNQQLKRRTFPRKYTNRDIALLAKTDELHDTPNGAAIKKILEREYKVFGQAEFHNISKISVAHIYNLRKTTIYRNTNQIYNKTKPAVSNLGIRKKPQPFGKPGYIRVDTVHQGDLEKQKGVYHINAVDEVTQFESIATVQKISENHMAPAVRQIIASFPFKIRGFHSDNGSEFVNKTVVALLNKLLIEFTKSRPRKSNDNALAESKNASVVRKHFGHGHIPQQWAPEVNEFMKNYLAPYINFHKPCFFPQKIQSEKGKIKITYPLELVMTPYDKLKSLPKAKSFLRENVSFLELDKIALQHSDNQFVKIMKNARDELFLKVQV